MNNSWCESCARKSVCYSPEICNIAFLCEMEDRYLSKDPEVVERLKKVFRGYQPSSEEGDEGLSNE